MDEGVSASTVKDRLGEVEVKLRSVSGSYGSNKFSGNAQAKMYVKDEEAKAIPVKHYDADGPWLLISPRLITTSIDLLLQQYSQK